MTDRDEQMPILRRVTHPWSRLRRWAADTFLQPSSITLASYQFERVPPGDDDMAARPETATVQSR